MRFQHLVFVTTLLGGWAVNAAFPSGRDEDGIDRLVKRLLKDWHTPGMSIAIIDGENTWAKGYGLAILPDTPVTPDTLFYMGSTTKSHTAAALSLLVDKGTFNWTTPVNTLIPEDFVLPDPWATTHITIEDVLSHRTGYGGHDLASQPSQQEFVRAFRHLPMTSEPRTKWRYSNHMYTTMGYLIEVATKKKLADVFKYWLWEPMGMSSTYLSLSEAEDTGKLAKPYWWNNKTQSYVTLPYAKGLENAQGAGMVISSVRDYAKYLKVLIDNSTPIPAAGHRELITPRIMLEPSNPYFTGPVWSGLGWESSIFENEVMHSHTGSVDGFNAVMAIIPARKLGLVVSTNVNAPSAARNTAWWHILYAFFKVPAEERVDSEESARRQAAATEGVFANPKSALFPTVPSPTVARPLPLPAYTGTFNHPAYHNVTLSSCNSTAGATCQLRGSPFVALGMQIHFEIEHVSGQWWLGRMFVDDHDPTVVYSVSRFQFEISGRVVTRVGIEMEAELYIWYDRVI